MEFRKNCYAIFTWEFSLQKTPSSGHPDLVVDRLDSGVCHPAPDRREDGRAELMTACAHQVALNSKLFISYICYKADIFIDRKSVV